MAVSHLLRKKRLLGIKVSHTLIIALLFGAVGGYLMFSTYASQTSAPDMYVEYHAGIPGNPVNTANVGDIITPTVRDESLQIPEEKREKVALIISWLYVSSRVTPNPVKCYPESSCKSISWPKFEGSHRWQAEGLFDRMFSICVDLPQRISRSVEDGNGLRIVTPYFVVKKNTDAIPIEMRTTYYRGSSCSVNDGRTGGAVGENEEISTSLYSAGTFFQCYNRDANKRPGNDANGFPTYCGLPGGNEPGIVTVGIEGEDAKTSGGKDKDKHESGAGSGSGDSDGQSPAPSHSSGGGGGGGSIAIKQDDEPNTLPSTSPQGTKDKQPKIKPSPFFDGKLFAIGSDPDTEAIQGVTIAGQKFGFGWVYLVGALILLAVGGFFGQRWWRNLSPAVKKKFAARFKK